jgi:hypothetical protein
VARKCNLGAGSNDLQRLLVFHFWYTQSGWFSLQSFQDCCVLYLCTVTFERESRR